MVDANLSEAVDSLIEGLVDRAFGLKIQTFALDNDRAKIEQEGNADANKDENREDKDENRIEDADAYY